GTRPPEEHEHRRGRRTRRMDSQSSDHETLEALLKKVQGAAAQSVVAPPGSSALFGDVIAAEPPPAAEARNARAELLRGVHLRVRAELGRTRLPLREALEIRPGSVLDLEKLADDPVDLYVNDLLIARGEVLVVNDCFCIRVT